MNRDSFPPIIGVVVVWADAAMCGWLVMYSPLWWVKCIGAVSLILLTFCADNTMARLGVSS